MSKYPVVSLASQIIPCPLQTKVVDVDEWEQSYAVWELNGLDYDEYLQGMFIPGEGSDYTMTMAKNMLRMLAFCIRTERTEDNAGGTRLWPDADSGIEHLGQMGQRGLDRLSTVARELNGIGKDGKKGDPNSSPQKSSSSSTSATPSATAPATDS